MTDTNENGGADQLDSASQAAARDAASLAVIAAALTEYGLAPDGVYNITEVTTGALGSLSDIRGKIALVGAMLTEAGLVTDTGDGLAGIEFIIVKYRELEAERDTLRNQLDEQELKAADASLKAANAAKAGPIKRADKKTAVAPIKLKSKEKPLDADGLLELISAAETVEVSFSDGEHEIASLGRRAIMGSAWVKSMGGLKLQVPEFAIYGPARGEAEVALDGYGLMLDNELVAYAKRSDPLKLRPNGQYDLKDDVIFG